MPGRARPRAVPLLVASVALAACAGAPPPVPSGSAAAPSANHVYTCSDGYRLGVRALDGAVVLALPDADVTLPHVVSASGAKYEAGGIVFWDKGGAALLEIGGSVHDECTGIPVGSPWERARLLGATFRAIGQEPGWTLEIHPDRLRYRGADGPTLVVTPAPEPDRLGAGTVVRRAETGSGTLVVTVRETPCSDTMSGIGFPHEVTVEVAGRELRGCGQPLNEGTLDGIPWTLVALGGVPVAPAADPPHLTLNVESPEVTGSTGCNRLRGPVERSGSRLRFGALVTTRRACTDAALAAQEREFLRALERVDRFARDGDELILYAGDTPVVRFRTVY